MKSVSDRFSVLSVSVVGLSLLTSTAGFAKIDRSTVDQSKLAVHSKVEFVRDEILVSDDFSSDLYGLESSNQTLGGPNLGDILAGIDLDKIINYGKQLWTFIEKNKPVVNIETLNANALPEGIRNAYDSRMRWPVNATKAKVYRIVFNNAFGGQVGSFEFRVIYTYGGSVAGKGKYLSGVKIVPGNVNVGWLNTLSAKVEVGNTYASGSEDSPIAVMELYFSWNMSNVLKNLTGTRSMIVRGDGSYQDITDGTALMPSYQGQLN